MAFALSPNEGPPRLIRFCELPPQVIAMLDRDTNVLRVDTLRFETLPDFDQREVLKTHAATIIGEHK